MRRLALGLVPLALAVWLALYLGAVELPGAEPSPLASAPGSPVVGVIVSVDSAGLGDVRGFRLRLAGGTLLDFTLGPLENAVEFAPGHLAEHLATSDPIRVWFRPGPGGELVVHRLEDASAPAPT